MKRVNPAMVLAPHMEEPDPEGEPIFADINITPLADVFLVMVVVFMIAALAVQADRKARSASRHRRASP